MHITGFLLAITALAAILPAQDPTVWMIDGAKSEARFTVTKLGFADVTGVFRESEGEIHYDPGRPEASRVWWRVRVASVVTDAANRDATLQDPEYFDARRHPFLHFESRSVRRRDDGRLEVAGQLTMRGVTHPLVTVVRYLPDAPQPRFETDFTVDRYDFGIVGGRVLGRAIGRTVRVRLVAVLTPAAH